MQSLFGCSLLIIVDIYCLSVSGWRESWVDLVIITSLPALVRSLKAMLTRDGSNVVYF